MFALKLPLGDLNVKRTVKQFKPETLTSLDQIVNTLLLNASFTDNIGLINGKMGISITFYHLSRLTGNKIYEDFAGELIDEIYEEILTNIPVEFENGLCGIGWGIEYLVQNNFIEGNTDEVLELIDKQVNVNFSDNTSNGFDLFTRILGLGAYCIKRIQNESPNRDLFILSALQEILSRIVIEINLQTGSAAKIIGEPQVSGKEIFDITWNYPVLIWLLSEILEQNFQNEEVYKIIERIVPPFSDLSDSPKLHSNRILLTLAMNKLKTSLNKVNGPNKLSFEIDRHISNLCTGISRSKIQSEFPEGCFTLRYGSWGIGWIYGQLFKITGNGHFEQEMKFWLNQTVTTEFGTMFFKGKTFGKVAGLMEGVTGIVFTHALFGE